MDIAANGRFGQMIFDVMRDRAVEAGFDVPKQKITTLGNFLLVACLHIGSAVISVQLQRQTPNEVIQLTSPPEWAMRVVRSNPATQVYTQTFVAMVWMSLLKEGMGDKAVQVILGIDGMFKKCGLRQLTDDEYLELATKAIAFNYEQQPPGKLGAAGDALQTTTLRHVQSASAGGTNAAQRRRKFNRTVRNLCLEVETCSTLGDRKATASRLGEALEAELRASHTPERATKMERFWQEFGFFFDATQVTQHYSQPDRPQE